MGKKEFESRCNLNDELLANTLSCLLMLPWSGLFLASPLLASPLLSLHSTFRHQDKVGAQSEKYMILKVSPERKVNSIFLRDSC